jgi:hypothetical protein
VFLENVSKRFTAEVLNRRAKCPPETYLTRADEDNKIFVRDGRKNFTQTRPGFDKKCRAHLDLKNIPGERKKKSNHGGLLIFLHQKSTGNFFF